MRVAVLGAGVAGVTTAYELARDGHEVTVIDRLPEAAAEDFSPDDLEAALAAELGGKR